MYRWNAVGLKHFTQPLNEVGSFQNRAQQQQAFAGVVMPGYQQQCVTYFGIAGKLLRTIYQPEVEPILHCSQVAGELGVIAIGIVDQVAGMNFEEARQ